MARMSAQLSFFWLLFLFYFYFLLLITERRPRRTSKDRAAKRIGFFLFCLALSLPLYLHAWIYYTSDTSFPSDTHTTGRLWPGPKPCDVEQLALI